MIHPPNGRAAPLSLSPLAILLIPNHLRGKVLVEKVMVLRTLSIALEPCSQCGSFVSMTSHPLLINCIRVKSDRLLIGQMNLKAIDGRIMLLHGKHVHAPVSFRAANIACIQVLLYLICASTKFHGDPIMALVHILVDVLDGLDRSNRLHIDVAPVLPDQVLGVTNHPAIISLPPSNLNSPASVATPGAGIRVLSDGCLLPELLGEALGALAIDHARCIPILLTTRPMNHELLDELQKLRIVLWKLRRHQTINVLWRVQLGMRLQEDNDVSMRKATLLKLNGVEVGIDVTQNTITDVLDEGVKLGLKGTHHQVRVIRSMLARKECRLHLRPARVGSHGDEQVSTPIVAVDGQGILTELLHVASAARK